MTFAMLAYCDHQRDFNARDNAPGMAFLDLTDIDKALQIITNDFKQLQSIDWPILSLHWGGNWQQRPSNDFIRLAHAAIDLGFKMIFGHSPHIFQGIEIYHGAPIFYATGDLVDDYYVAEDEYNDHQLLYSCHIANNELTKIDLYPMFIANCQTQFANTEQSEWITHRIKMLCDEMETQVIKQKNHLTIQVV